MNTSSVERVELSPQYSISRIIQGCWQLSEGHALGSAHAAREIIAHLSAYREKGITTFDMGDIYRGVEELVGVFVDHLRGQCGHHMRDLIQLHTKYVPDLNALPSLQCRDTESIVHRSLSRLRVETLDLVQLHWWDYGVPRYREALEHLFSLSDRGKIRHVGVTNFDIEHMREFVEAGLKPASIQLQYSLLDRRPEHGMVSFCKEQGIPILCYGTVAGGFLSERYLGMPEPPPPLANRSLTKYKLIIDEFGGWELFQELLHTLQDIANKHRTSIAVIASAYVLQKPGVAAVMIGAHGKSHVEENVAASEVHLDPEDLSKIAAILHKSSGPQGDVYTLERTDGKHSCIMQKNNNAMSTTFPSLHRGATG